MIARESGQPPEKILELYNQNHVLASLKHSMTEEKTLNNLLENANIKIISIWKAGMKIPLRPPITNDVVETLTKAGTERLSKILMMNIGPEQKGEYLHWDQLRHKSPPEGLSHEEWWFLIKKARKTNNKSIELKDPHNKEFNFTLTEALYKKLSQVDRDAGGAIAADPSIVTEENRNRYITKSLFEEAITSSQLEGASTTTREAKKMLHSQRKPRDRSEQMIMNNYRAMSFVRDHRQDSLSEGFILELHRIVTENTMDDPDASGRWRTADGHIHVTDNRDGTILYTPPPADQIPGRMKKLIEFANSDHEKSFIHPIIQGIVLHFMLSYEHPFADGNGRTARILFYWLMSQKEYRLIEFISISKPIKQSPTKYARAFLYVETDDNDLTYFLHQQSDVIIKSISMLKDYWINKQRELNETKQLLEGPIQKELNHRQTALITHALRHPNHLYEIQPHKISHQITYETARQDLLGLEGLGLLVKTKKGKAFIFQSPSDIPERIGRLNKECSM
jgi:Fic family protein